MFRLTSCDTAPHLPRVTTLITRVHFLIWKKKLPLVFEHRCHFLTLALQQWRQKDPTYQHLTNHYLAYIVNIKSRKGYFQMSTTLWSQVYWTGLWMARVLTPLALLDWKKSFKSEKKILQFPHMATLILSSTTWLFQDGFDTFRFVFSNEGIKANNLRFLFLKPFFVCSS